MFVSATENRSNRSRSLQLRLLLFFEKNDQAQVMLVGLNYHPPSMIVG
jgi:hypothetical protein